MAIAIVAFVVPMVAPAQTEPQYTQYFEAPTVYNPGAIGSNDEGIRIRAGGRLQWVGIDNAPKDFLLTGDMALPLFGKRFGVGIVAQQGSAGLFRNVNVGLQAGYKQKLFKGELTAAVQFGFVNEVFKGSQIYIPDDDDYHEATDEGLPQVDVSGNSIDIGVGVQYVHKWFWAGVSCTHLNSPTITFSDDNGNGSSTTGGSSTAKNYEFGLRRTLYFIGGSNIQIKNTLFEVMPSFLVKSDFTFTRFEVTGRVRYKKFLTAGVGYRHDDAVSAILGAEYKGFFIGYSYDYPITAISKASHGSHELMLGYTVKLKFDKKNNNKHKSIRIM
ncbi:MAG: PorP/SprF family type IX secretion system membrane protein [Bacteroides sp.]|nr:PorP/SprF family type IX secretion system membrane protein [Bacteroides sp.]MCM1413998.1 PorP/SprF family type IX secretion system membrane protein [Bacteroides sp.]MCM1472307.1 PorP/SprF family type IX secretion system membrane protein [Bacteroides sp.]